MIILKNVLWGIRQLAGPAGLCILLAAAATMTDGASLGWPIFASFLAFYVSMGLAAGIVLGVARPLLASTFGRGIVGFLVALPIAYVALFRPPRGDGVGMDSVSIGTWIVLSAVFGPVGAAYVAIRNRPRNADRDPDA